MAKTKRRSMLKRVRLVEPRTAAQRVHDISTSCMINNKPPKDWDLGYELVVSFPYGLDEDAIRKVAGLKNYDSGITLCGPGTGIRDLQFPCGTDLGLAQDTGLNLQDADHFGALTLKISYPVRHEGKDSFTDWYDIRGKLIESVKHRREAFSGKRTLKTKKGK